MYRSNGLLIIRQNKAREECGGANKGQNSNQPGIACCEKWFSRLKDFLIMQVFKMFMDSVHFSLFGMHSR